MCPMLKTLFPGELLGLAQAAVAGLAALLVVAAARRRGIHLEKELKTGIKQDDCEDFTIKGAHFRTESVINAFRVVEMLLGEGIFAGQGAEAQRGNQSGGFGLREEAAEVSEARAGQPGERAVFGEEIAGQGGIGGVQQRAQSIYFGEGVRTKIRQSAHRTGVQRDRVVDCLADRKVTLLVRFK